jgi:hypothetical protein
MEVTEAAAKPSTNGVLKIHVAGKLRCQLGNDEAPIVEVDVVNIHTLWQNVNKQYLVENGTRTDEEGNVVTAYTITDPKAQEQAMLEFVKSVIKAHSEGNREQPDLDVANAWAFITEVTARTSELTKKNTARLSSRRNSGSGASE